MGIDIPINIYQRLAFIKERPSMFVGSKSLTPLYHYLNGYIDGARATLANAGFPDFEWFSSWVKGLEKSGYDLSAGWLHHILAVCGNDEGKALERFFELLEEFKNTKPVCEIQQITDNQRIFYKHSHGSYWMNVYEKTCAIVIWRLVPGRTYWILCLDSGGNALAEYPIDNRVQAIQGINFNFAISKEWEKMSTEQSLLFLTNIYGQKIQE